jgi:hypothetical protein
LACDAHTPVEKKKATRVKVQVIGLYSIIFRQHQPISVEHAILFFRLVIYSHRRPPPFRSIYLASLRPAMDILVGRSSSRPGPFLCQGIPGRSSFLFLADVMPYADFSSFPDIHLRPVVLGLCRN